MENVTETQENRYFDAKKKVDAIKGFYGNLTSFVVVNCFLFILNWVTSPHNLWFFWPLLWWGIGVAFHGLKVFGLMPILGKDWEDRKVKELLENEEKSKTTWE